MVVLRVPLIRRQKAGKERSPDARLSAKVDDKLPLRREAMGDCNQHLLPPAHNRLRGRGGPSLSRPLLQVQNLKHHARYGACGEDAGPPREQRAVERQIPLP